MRGMIRIIANGMLLASVVLAPWWLYAALLVCSIAYFDDFYEAFIWSFVADILFGARSAAGYHVPMLFMFGTFAAFFGILWIKKRLRHSW